MKNSNTAERLKEIMLLKGLKQIDVLERAKPYCEKYDVKLTKTDLSQYINGKSEPGQEKLTVLGLALNVSEPWLMGYNVDMGREKKSPAPPEGSAGENGKLSVDEVEKVLLSLGLIQEGQDVTEDDLRFINSVLDLIDMWFQNRHQQG